MADKLTNLPNLPTPEVTDKVYVVDVSDTTDDPAGSSKEAAIGDLPFADAVHTHVKADITDFSDGDYAAAVHTHTESEISDLGAYIEDAPSDGNQYARKDGLWDVVEAGTGGGGGTVSGGLKKLLASAENTTAGAFNITGLDLTGYDKLIIEARVRSAAINSFDNITLKWNGYGSSSHSRGTAGQRTGTSVQQESGDASIGEVPGANASADQYATIIYEVLRPAVAEHKVGMYRISAVYQDTNPDAIALSGAHSFNVSEALTEFELQAGGLEGLIGTVKVYGEMDTATIAGPSTEIDMPVVQSVAYDTSASAIGFQSEAGWVITKNATGKYAVTFPTAAASVEEQSIVVTASTNSDNASPVMFRVNQRTATGCEVVITNNDTDTNIDRDFSLVRRLPNETVNVVAASEGVTKTRAVRTEIARVEDAGTNTITFSNIPTDFDTLYLVADMSSDQVASQAISCYINGDLTDANYKRQMHYSGGPSDTSIAADDAFCAIIAGTGTLTTSLPFEVQFNGANRIGTEKMYWSKANNVTGDPYNRVTHSDVFHEIATNEITEITLKSSAGAINGRAILYGEKTESIGAGGGTSGDGMTLEFSQTQSASFDSAGVLQSSNETGWSCSKVSTGIYDITFPNSAVGEIVASPVSTGDGAASITANIHNITNTGCTIKMRFSGSENVLDYPFVVYRNLPNETYEIPAGPIIAKEVSGYMYASVDQSIPNNLTTNVDFDTTSFAYGADMTDPVNNRLTFTEAGRYLINAAGGLDAMTSDFQSWTILQYDSADVEKERRTIYLQEPSSQTVASGTFLMDMAVGDYIVMTAYQNTGSARNTRSGKQFTYLSYSQIAVGHNTTVAGQQLHGVEEVIETWYGGSNQHTFTVPSGYDRLFLRGTVKNDTSAESEIWYNLNGDSTPTNYHRQRNYGNNGGANVDEADQPEAFLVPVSTDSANAIAWFETEFYDYEGSRLKGWMTTVARNSSTTAKLVGSVTTGHDTMTAPITSIRMFTQDGTGQLVGKVELIGTKTITVPAPLPLVKTTETTVQQVNLGKVTLNGTATNFDFNNLSLGGYDRVILKGHVRSAYGGGVVDDLSMYFNSDYTDAGYFHQRNIGRAGAALLSAIENPVIALVPSSTAVANATGGFEITIETPNQGKLWTANSSYQAYATVASNAYAGQHAWAHDTQTADITRIQLSSSNLANLTGEVTLIGEKSIDVVTDIAGADPVAKGYKQEIAKLVNTTAGEFNFNGIDSSKYTRLIIEGQMRGDNPSLEASTRVFFNDDLTESAYHMQHFGGTDGVGSGSESALPYAGAMPGDSAPANSYGNFRMTIENPSSSYLKMARIETDAYTANDTLTQRNVSLVSPTTASIDQIRVRSNNHPTQGFLGELTLYGEV